MIQLPHDKVFLVKFSSDVHRDIVSRMILHAQGQVSRAANREELISQFKQCKPSEIAGVVYELGDETIKSGPYNFLTDVKSKR